MNLLARVSGFANVDMVVYDTFIEYPYVLNSIGEELAARFAEKYDYDRIPSDSTYEDENMDSYDQTIERIKEWNSKQ